jgi:hypothetical protein
MAETQSIQVEGNVTGSEAPVPEVAEDRPEWLPEKFKSPEELSKAYGALEKQFTQSRQEASEADTSEPEPETTADARQAVENAGVDFEGLQQEFADNGELSDSTYEDLQKRGIPRDMVDTYIEGQKALATEYQTELYGFAGGEENYNEMAEWATENLSEDEVDAYNDAIVSGNSAQARLAIDGLVQRYRNAEGVQPRLVGGKASSSVDTYASWAQVTADMAKPEYKKDPAYRQAVSNKLARSNPS